MPTYEYACASCHRHVEKQQSFTDPPLAECPHCGGRLRRVFHPVGIVLKGSGFYSTDNRSGRKGATEPTKETKEPAEAKEPAAKGESKSATSTDGAATPKEPSGGKKKAKK